MCLGVRGLEAVECFANESHEAASTIDVGEAFRAALRKLDEPVSDRVERHLREPGGPRRVARVAVREPTGRVLPVVVEEADVLAIGIAGEQRDELGGISCSAPDQ